MNVTQRINSNPLTQKDILNVVRSGLNKKQNTKAKHVKVRGIHPPRHYQLLLKPIKILKCHVAFGDCQFKYEQIVIGSEYNGGISVSIPTNALGQFKPLLKDFSLMPYKDNKSRSRTSRLTRTTRFWSDSVSDNEAFQIFQTLAFFYRDNYEKMGKDVLLHFFPNMNGNLTNALKAVGIQTKADLVSEGYINAFRKLKHLNPKIPESALLKIYACCSDVLYQNMTDSQRASVIRKYLETNC